MLASRCVSFYETKLKQVLSFALDFFLIYAKMTLNTVLGRNVFSIANDCSVNFSDHSKMSVKKQMKYCDVPLEHAWKVPVLQDVVNPEFYSVYSRILNAIINSLSSYLLI